MWNAKYLGCFREKIVITNIKDVNAELKVSDYIYETHAEILNYQERNTAAKIWTIWIYFTHISRRRSLVCFFCLSISCICL